MITYKVNWREIKDILPDITEIKSLDLSDMGLTEFPKMSHITIADWVDCSNNQLKTFKGCPQINGNFYCNNNLITSFKDCPIVRGSLYSDFEIFNKVHEYSKENIITLLEAQVDLYSQQDKDI